MKNYWKHLSLLVIIIVVTGCIIGGIPNNNKTIYIKPGETQKFKVFGTEHCKNVISITGAIMMYQYGWSTTLPWEPVNPDDFCYGTVTSYMEIEVTPTEEDIGEHQIESSCYTIMSNSDDPMWGPCPFGKNPLEWNVVVQE